MARRGQDERGATGEPPAAYDWIDDPFDEQKAADEREATALSGKAKAFAGCGLALAAVALMVGGVLAVLLTAL